MIYRKWHFILVLLMVCFLSVFQPVPESRLTPNAAAPRAISRLALGASGASGAILATPQPLMGKSILSRGQEADSASD